MTVTDIPDLLLRGMGIGVLAAVAWLFLTQAPVGRGRHSVPILVIVLAAYLVLSAPMADLLPDPLRRALAIVATGGPAALTWVLLELLTDPPLPRWPWLAASGVIVAAGWAAMIWPPAALLRGGLAVIFYLLLFGLVLRVDRDDLVPSRRRLRRWILALSAMMAIGVSVVENWRLDEGAGPVLFLVQASLILTLAIAGFIWAARIAPDLAEAPRTLSAQPTSPGALAQRAQRAMRDGLWRTEGLTIGALAQTLGAPEHRLRQAINRDLGFRNFSSFVNGYRIGEARKMLSDPMRGTATILEIAYDCGFGSVGPFNRAFRAETGQSPSEYRVDSLKSEPIPKNPA
ncbi:MAG: AraC family transcriptional regulator [Pseudomonadota bacterium]